MKITKSLTALFFCITCFSGFADDTNTDWIYCVVTDEYNDAAYFTEIFHGNYDNMEEYETQFYEHILNKYGDEIDEGVSCTFEEEKSATELEFNEQFTDTKDFYANVIKIAWK